MFRMFSTLTFLGLLSLSAVRAQSGKPMQAKIPFNFTVRNTTLAAGAYNVSYGSNSHILSIQGQDRNSRTVFTLPVPKTTAAGTGKLVFHCYEQACHLAEVSEGSGGQVWGILQERQQRRVALVTRTVLMTTPVK